MQPIIVMTSRKIDPQISSGDGAAVLMRANIRMGEKKGIMDMITETVLCGFFTIKVIVTRGMIRSITIGKDAC